MSSIEEGPKSSVASRSGIETLGNAYRTTTIPVPPCPPKLVDGPTLGYPAPPPPPPVLTVPSGARTREPILPAPPPPAPPAPGVPW